METKIVKDIQVHIKQLTKSNISKKKIKKFFLPIIYYIYKNKNNKFLISGSQGVGKTTLLKITEKILKKYFNKRVLSLSLDDFYFDKNERLDLSNKTNPLLKTRGVPGTHNTKLLIETIKKFEKKIYPIKIPIFEKIIDKRQRCRKIIYKKCDILILEGWCLGCPPISKKFLLSNINDLEKKYDTNGKWRNYYNSKLKNDYSKIFKKFNTLIYLNALSFSNILNWRTKQEKQLSKKNTKYKDYKMSKKEIINFIQYYEKITKWMLLKMPMKANVIINITNKQEISEIIIKN